MADEIVVDVEQVAVAVNAPMVAVAVAVEDAPVTVDSVTSVVAVNVTGSQGPAGQPGGQGDTGPAGPPGPPGSAFVYVHHQSTLASVWDIQHNMAKHPVVFVEDGGGTQIYGTVNYVDDNRLTVTFMFNATGRANCS